MEVPTHKIDTAHAPIRKQIVRFRVPDETMARFRHHYPPGSNVSQVFLTLLTAHLDALDAAPRRNGPNANH